METGSVARVHAAFLADNSLQSVLLKESIEKETNLAIKLVSPEKLTALEEVAHEQMPELMIIDLATCRDGVLEHYQQLRASCSGECKEVLLNCQGEVQYKEMLKWRNLVGVFYTSDSLEILIQGITKVLEGELWLSRRLMHEYIKFYRERQNISTNSDYSILTKREQQIIKMLGDGASNQQIADALYVSENTVKTHLHNAFKKLKVKNRLQALLWVKENVASEEFV